ncbi:hypothetical protein PP707_02430, partial [Acetobacter pasteurianus]|nr:hypothetical protein [Acetobacter pasteurianus]
STVESETNSYTNEFLERYRLNPGSLLSTLRIRHDYDQTLQSLNKDLKFLMDAERDLYAQICQKIASIDPRAKIAKKETLGRRSHVLIITTKDSAKEKIIKLLGNGVLESRAKTVIYRSKEWLDIQHNIKDKQESIAEAEESVIKALKMQVFDELHDVRLLAKAADYLDVTSSFAIIAEENEWTCPKIVNDTTLNIVGGRHVVVDTSLREARKMFVRNNSYLDEKERMWIISGPNMGGKSTFLRQNALIVILAQMGSFVPAEKATIGIVDKIFTRIGASDDLYNDLSTFMVEMVETSNILRNATARSLALVDEIGRGTSGKEGLAIAYAALVALLQSCKCRAFFATHFAGELKNLLDARGIEQDSILFYRTKVFKSSDSTGQNLPIIIDHTLEPGISERSYALEVARQAGFPDHVLKEAEVALAML